MSLGFFDSRKPNRSRVRVAITTGGKGRKTADLLQLKHGSPCLRFSVTPGMADPRFMTAISTNPDLETIVRSGVSLTLKKRMSGDSDTAR